MRLPPPRTLTLTAIALGGYGSATTAMAQDTTNTDTSWTASRPLTGRAIPCEGGTIRLFKCHNVELLSYLPSKSLDRSAGYDLWGWHDSATSREFIIIGRHSAAFVEVTDPVNPKYLGVLHPHEKVTKSAPFSVKVYQHYALIGYNAAGLQIFDLRQLRDVNSPPVVFQEAARYPNSNSTHTLTMNQETGFAYVNSGSNACGGGLHMIDVRTPTRPTFAGCYTDPNLGGGRSVYIHDAQCVVYRGPDQPYQGREICVNYAIAAISIADVTDKQKPKTISIFTYPNVGLVHQGWFSEDHRYIFVNDEGDEYQSGGKTRTIGFDLSDLDDPVMLTEFFHTTTATDHNLYIRGRYMYQGNNGAGLRIIDIADPKNPKEAGYLTRAGAAWGTYPYLKNDVVAMSTSKGLFLARLLKR